MARDCPDLDVPLCDFLAHCLSVLEVRSRLGQETAFQPENATCRQIDVVPALTGIAVYLGA